MIFAYIRVSTDKQTVENQRFEILKKTAANRVHVDEWIEETVLGTRSASDRALGPLFSSMKPKDVLYVTDLGSINNVMC